VPVAAPARIRTWGLPQPGDGLLHLRCVSCGVAFVRQKWGLCPNCNGGNVRVLPDDELKGMLGS